MGRKRQTLALPPDPEQMNDDRAKWALSAVSEFGYTTGECFETFKGDQRLTILEQNISDLLCDLAHLCDREGMNLTHLISRARRHYNEETDRKGGQL